MLAWWGLWGGLLGVIVALAVLEGCVSYTVVGEGCIYRENVWGEGESQTLGLLSLEGGIHGDCRQAPAPEGPP